MPLPALLLLLLFAVSTGALPSHAQEAASDPEAQALRLEIEYLAQQSVETARKTQDLESELTAIETTLRGLRDSQAETSAILAEESAQLSVLLGALQRLALQPPEALLANPGAPIDTVRSAILLSVAVPNLERRADALKEDLAKLASLRDEILEQRQAVEERGRELEIEQGRLEELLAAKRALEADRLAEAEAEARRLAEIAEQTEDPGRFIERLEEEDAQAQPEPAESMAQTAALPAPRLSRPENIRPFPREAGGLVQPARGEIVLKFGERAELSFGEPSKGIALSTRPGARVVAPFDGKVAYSGPFRRYGLILIIEHDGQYHSLLAGLERVDAVVGQWVLAGEPIGVMSSREGRNPHLYLELRRNGQPVNPQPWLSSNGREAEG